MYYNASDQLILAQKWNISLHESYTDVPTILTFEIYYDQVHARYEQKEVMIYDHSRK